MCALRVLTRSVCSSSSSYVKTSKPYLTLILITHHQYHYQHQTHRTLILDSSASEFVKLHKLTGPDSGKFLFFYSIHHYYDEFPYFFVIFFTGIVEISLDRPQAKNAIGKEMLRGLSHAFELINQKSYANVAMISSSVPGVFCAGADLKVNC